MPERPKVICLCGSTRFPDAFALANADRSMRGDIVISVGLLGHADEPRGAKYLTSDGDESTPEKRGLDELHFRKIDLADEILVINVADYIGSSTQREIAYAERHGKPVRFMFEHAGVDAVALPQDVIRHIADGEVNQADADILQVAAQSVARSPEGEASDV